MIELFKSNRIVVITALFMALTFSHYSFAKWVQGEASMSISGVNLDDVRTMAIKSAIADASFKNGGFVVAEEISLDGLLVSSKSQIRTHGRIQRVEILEEKIDDNDILSITVRVDILPLFDCAKDQYSRSILVTQFQIQNPSQASYGGIYDFGRQVSRRFENQLRNQSYPTNVLLIEKSFMPVFSQNQLNLQQATDKAVYLANQYGHQFILFGFVRDLSMFEQVTEALISDDVSLRRNFTVEVYVLDAYRHALVFKDNYHGEANWKFKKSMTVDTNNSVFWRSDYGRVALNTINAAVQDVSNTITCEKGFAQVINADGENITISMGSRDGVKKGDKFELYKKQLVASNSGTNTPLLRNGNEPTLSVVSVNDNSATLKPDANAQATNATLYDLVSPLDIFE